MTDWLSAGHFLDLWIQWVARQVERSLQAIWLQIRPAILETQGVACPKTQPLATRYALQGETVHGWDFSRRRVRRA